MVSKFLRKYKPVYNFSLSNPVKNILYKPVEEFTVEFSIRYNEYNQDDESETESYGYEIFIFNLKPFRDSTEIEKFIQDYGYVYVSANEKVHRISIYKFAPVFFIDYLSLELPLDFSSKYLPAQFFAFSDILTGEEFNYPAIKDNTYIRDEWQIGVLNNSVGHSLSIDLYINADFSSFCQCKFCQPFKFLWKTNELLWFLQAYRFNYYQFRSLSEDYVHKFRITRFTKSSFMRLCI